MNPDEYSLRQSNIDKKLTPAVVNSIVAEHAQAIFSRVLTEVDTRHVVIIYASTAALLRRIEGVAEKPLAIDFEPLVTARKRQPSSNLLKQCDGKTSFCVTIGTALPLRLVGFMTDGFIQQSVTCLSIPHFVSKDPAH